MINESANQNDPKRAGDRDGNKPLPSSNKPDTDKGEPFALERAFPEPAEIFRRLDALSARSNSVLIVLDANTLLLPYHLKPTGLGPLENIFTKLSNEKRLFVPARAVREFAKHRSSKLSDIISALSKRQSEQPKTEMPQFLAGTQEFSDLEASYSRYKEVRNQYMKSLKQLTKKLRSWNGDDPVSALYEKIFKPETIVEPTEAPDQLLAEWRRRFADKMPPGYKDGAKGHDAIGDFLIWKAILQLGAREKKGTIFVTGDEKADWFVRTDGRGVFPRPELIEEYRRVTKGHAFRLMSLDIFVAEMGGEETVVEEIRVAETKANTVIASQSAAYSFSGRANVRVILRGSQVFDYSKNNGIVTVGTDDARFDLKFDKQSERTIYLRTSFNVPSVARAKGAKRGQTMYFDDYDSTSDIYTIHVGEFFLARNLTGHILIGEILSIKDDDRGDAVDEIAFQYTIHPPTESAIQI